MCAPCQYIRSAPGPQGTSSCASSSTMATSGNYKDSTFTDVTTDSDICSWSDSEEENSDERATPSPRQIPIGFIPRVRGVEAKDIKGPPRMCKGQLIALIEEHYAHEIKTWKEKPTFVKIKLIRDLGEFGYIHGFPMVITWRAVDWIRTDKGLTVCVREHNSWDSYQGKTWYNNVFRGFRLAKMAEECQDHIFKEEIPNLDFDSFH